MDTTLIYNSPEFEGWFYKMKLKLKFTLLVLPVFLLGKKREKTQENVWDNWGILSSFSFSFSLLFPRNERADGSADENFLQLEKGIKAVTEEKTKCDCCREKKRKEKKKKIQGRGLIIEGKWERELCLDAFGC